MLYILVEFGEVNKRNYDRVIGVFSTEQRARDMCPYPINFKDDKEKMEWVWAGIHLRRKDNTFIESVKIIPVPLDELIPTSFPIDTFYEFITTRQLNANTDNP